MKKFEYRYTVGFEDTNLVGNVYFSNFIRWQGKCREFFIKKNAPIILDEIESDNLALITLNCSCQFLSELRAFDDVIILMSLESIQQNRIKMIFEYFKVQDGDNKKVATGSHEIGCFKRLGNELKVSPIPQPLLRVLNDYAN